MKKTLIFILAIVALAAAQTENYSGWRDTSIITTVAADSLKYGRVQLLSPYDNSFIVTEANDTTAAGYASDSINLIIGYRLGFPIIQSGGKLDTAWSYRIAADTMAMYDSTTKANNVITSATATGSTIATGLEVRLSKKIDTTNVTGYAVIVSKIEPAQAPLIQPFVKGLTGNCNTKLKLLVSIQHRLYQPTRNQ